MMKVKQLPLIAGVLFLITFLGTQIYLESNFPDRFNSNDKMTIADKHRNIFEKLISAETSNYPSLVS